MTIQQNARADRAATLVVHPTPGIGDATTIADAVSMLPAAGGDIYVRSGTYTISSTIAFGSKIVRLRGEGASVAFATGPTTLVPAADVTMFTSTEDGSSIEDMVIEGDNTSAQIFWAGADARFSRLNIHDVGGIITGTPEVAFNDSFINIPSGPSTADRFLWSGGAAGGTLVFNGVEMFITGSGATIMSGVTATQNGPTFKVINSYTGGGGGGGSTNFWFAEIVDWVNFNIDNAQFEISNTGSQIVNCEFLDFSIKFKGLWNFITNSNFSQGGTNGALFDAQVTLDPNIPATPQQNFITGCNFYGNSASVYGVSIVDAIETIITGCSFNNHTTAGINASGDASFTVHGCRFTEATPVNEAASTVRGIYSGNDGFGDSTIVGNGSLVEGVIFTQTNSVTVANTAAETTLAGIGIGSLTLPADFLKVGTTLRVKARGFISDTGSPNFTAKIKFGSTVILSTDVVAFSGAIFTNEWHIDADITCRTTGVSGTVAAQGVFEEEPTGSCPSENSASMRNTSTVTVNTTTSQVIDVTFQWGTADPANTITCTNLLIEAIGTV